MRIKIEHTIPTNCSKEIKCMDEAKMGYYIQMDIK
jgi:hypothetical protein